MAIFNKVNNNGSIGPTKTVTFKVNKTLSPTPVLYVPTKDKEIGLLGTADDYRIIVLHKEIQMVRNLESFLTYHKQNPGSLIKLLENAYWASMLPEEKVQSFYRKSKSNHLMMVRDVSKAMPGGNFGGLYGASAYGPPFYSSVVPVLGLVQLSINWIQGLIIDVYGTQGFDIIKEAKAAGEARWLNELRIH